MDWGSTKATVGAWAMDVSGGAGSNDVRITPRLLKSISSTKPTAAVFFCRSRIFCLRSLFSMRTPSSVAGPPCPISKPWAWCCAAVSRRRRGINADVELRAGSECPWPARCTILRGPQRSRRPRQRAIPLQPRMRRGRSPRQEREARPPQGRTSHPQCHRSSARLSREHRGCTPWVKVGCSVLEALFRGLGGLKGAHPPEARPPASRAGAVLQAKRWPQISSSSRMPSPSSSASSMLSVPSLSWSN